MAEHHASVTVNAPVHQVYQLFTHFNDFPKFMSFVKEVTYYDDQTSHWVAEVVGQHEWDAVNRDWIEDQQIGWVSTNGLKNSGRVTFRAASPEQTIVDVFISYDPPAGVLGKIGENLGAGEHFEEVLQHDLNNFAEMVRQAPPGSLDPTSSSYLFHPDSAVAMGRSTEQQKATMADATTDQGTPIERPTLDSDIIGESDKGLPEGKVPPAETTPGGLVMGYPGSPSDMSGLPKPAEPQRPDET